MNFLIYKGHGLAKIIETKENHYILETDQLTIIVPRDKLNTLTRPVMSIKEAKKVIRTIMTMEVKKIDDNTWNKRYREYIEIIKTGDPMSMAIVCKTLIKIKDHKDLSFGERKMLDHIKDVLYTELKFVLGETIQKLA